MFRLLLQEGEVLVLFKSLALFHQLLLPLFFSFLFRLLSTLRFTLLGLLEFLGRQIAFGSDLLYLLFGVRLCLLLRRLFLLLDFQLSLLLNFRLTRLGFLEFLGHLFALGECFLYALVRFVFCLLLRSLSLLFEFLL